MSCVRVRVRVRVRVCVRTCGAGGRGPGSFHFVSAGVRLLLPQHRHAATLSNGVAALATSFMVFRGAPLQQRVLQSLVVSGVVGGVSHLYGTDV